MRNRMREIRSSGSVGERGGNEPLYPESNYPERKQVSIRGFRGKKDEYYNTNN
jgi:hypothetical protein